MDNPVQAKVAERIIMVHERGGERIGTHLGNIMWTNGKGAQRIVGAER